MTRTLTGIGLTIAAASFGAALVAAQDTTATERTQTRPATVEAGRQARAQAQGRLGPGRGLGRGRALGPAQRSFGRGPGMAGRGAQAPRGPQAGRGGPFGRGPGAGLRALALTDDQRTKVTDLHRAERDQAAPIHDELDVARNALHRALFADNRDAGGISNLSATIATLEKQLADLHVQTATAVADVLTAEQRETMRLRHERAGGR